MIVDLHNLPVSLRQLQYFLAVAEELHFRKASERCGVSQPGLSAQLATLEETLGMPLFERRSRNVLLTAEGQQLLPRAEAVLRGVADLVAQAQGLTDPERGVLTVGVIPTIGPYLLPRIVAPLAAAFPHLALHWVEGRTEDLMARVHAGTLDGALLALEADIGDVERAELFWDPFLLALPPDHALARRRRRFDVAELAHLDLMLLDEGHCLRDQVVSLCRAHNVGEQRFRATSLSTLSAMVAAGRGVTLLPELAVDIENQNDRMCLRRPHGEGLGRTVGWVWRKGSPKRSLFTRLAEVSAHT